MRSCMLARCCVSTGIWSRLLFRDSYPPWQEDNPEYAPPPENQTRAPGRNNTEERIVEASAEVLSLSPFVTQI
jgi:hypothetical protein